VANKETFNYEAKFRGNTFFSITRIPKEYKGNLNFHPELFGAIFFLSTVIAIAFFNLIIFATCLFVVLTALKIDVEFTIWLPLAILIMAEIARGNGLRAG
jgi:hypothetical protein